MSLEKEAISCFERVCIGVGEGEAEKVLGQMHSNEVFAASGLVVGNNLESSCISKMWCHLVVG